MPHSRRTARAPAWVFALLALFDLGTGGAARAAVLLGGAGDEDVVVPAHEVVDDDVVAWGSYVRVDGIVKGDLVALASEVEVEGVIEGDLFALGKTVHLNGSVADDARIAAYAVAIGDEARIGDDAFVAAFSLETRPGSRIGGALLAATRQTLLAGQVAEGLALRTTAFELRGLVGSDVRAVVGGLEGFQHSAFWLDLAIELPEVDEGVRLTRDARIGGNLDYRAVRPAVIEDGASIGGETLYEPWLVTSRTLPVQGDEDEGWPEESDGRRAAWQRLGALAAIGLLLVALAPRWSRHRIEDITDAPLQALGWGFGAIVFVLLLSIVLGIVSLLLLVLLSGLGAALTVVSAGFLAQAALGAPFLLALVFVAPVLTSLALGDVVLRRLLPALAAGPALRRGALTACAGALIYGALRAVPGLGPVVGFCGALVGLGALALWLRELAALAGGPEAPPAAVATGGEAGAP